MKRRRPGHNSSSLRPVVASQELTAADSWPGRSPMKPIHLSPQQGQELQRRHQTRDKRIYERLSAVLWVAEGKTRIEVAGLLGRSVRQLADWLRLFRNRGLDGLCTLHHRGDPGNLSAGQVERLKQEISTGRFRTSDQVRRWVEETFGISYTPSGINDLLQRCRQLPQP